MKTSSSFRVGFTFVRQTDLQIFRTLVRIRPLFLANLHNAIKFPCCKGLFRLEYQVRRFCNENS